MSIFDGLLGGVDAAAEIAAGYFPFGNGPLCNQAYSLQQQWAQYQHFPQKLLEPGIDWKRTGPRSHRVTIRTQAEWVPDYQKMAEMQTQANPFLMNGLLGQRGV